ncbi:helix-turn-helix transcriptional regulator [Leekyejoonella antrihumi]|nr:LuxR C-terminal-related transcriptional regulator [Leekyejoonella antrihumi]
MRERPGSSAIGSNPDDGSVDIYLAALRHSVISPDDLESVGFSAAEVSAALEQFTKRGLVNPVSDEHWQVIPPEVALTSLAARLEERARSLRSSAPGLARIYTESQATAAMPLSGVTALTSVVAVDSAVQQMIAGATASVHMMHSNSPYLRMLLTTTPERHGRQLLSSLGRPLRVEVTFDTALLTDDRLGSILDRRAAAGDEQRFTRSLPFSAYANDNGMAVLDLEDNTGRSIGLALTPGAGSAAILRAIRWAWQLGVTWHAGDPPTGENDSFDKRDREILRLIAAGSSDSTVARQLGVSQRTVERRVRIILDRLNAVNRFQAGVLAARNGLL